MDDPSVPSTSVPDTSRSSRKLSNIVKANMKEDTEEGICIEEDMPQDMDMEGICIEEDMPQDMDMEGICIEEGMPQDMDMDRNILFAENCRKKQSWTNRNQHK